MASRRFWPTGFAREVVGAVKETELLKSNVDG